MRPSGVSSSPSACENLPQPHTTTLIMFGTDGAPPPQQQQQQQQQQQNSDVCIALKIHKLFCVFYKKIRNEKY